MRKSVFYIRRCILFLFTAVLFLACSVSIQNTQKELPHNTDADSKVVDLTPSAPIEYDTSMPTLPNLQSVGAGTPAPVLILMYHHIVELSEPGTYDRTLQDFESDLQYLQDNDITVIRLSDLSKIQSGDITPLDGQRFAVITFDDGYTSQYEDAVPLLKEYDMPATFFLITSVVGTENYMTWNQIEELANYSPPGETQPFFEIGSHTVDHQSLAYDATKYPDKNDYIVFLNMEMNQSKEAILQHVNQSNIFIALPYGDGSFEQEVKYAAIRTGYTGIRTSIYGAFDAYNTDWNYHLPSLAILGDTDISVLSSYYDPLLQPTGMVNIAIH